MPLKAVKTAKFAVLDAGGLKPAKAAEPRQAPAAAAAPPPAGVTVIDDDAANVVLAKLNELNIAHRTYAHVAVPTVGAARRARCLAWCINEEPVAQRQEGGHLPRDGRRGPARGHEEAAYSVRY